MTDLTRRQFAALTAATVAAPLVLVRSTQAAPAVSAGDIVERIRKGIGVDWKAETVDTLKAGDAATTVTGVVTTALASMAILRQAVDAGANMVVTCEPTFYCPRRHADSAGRPRRPRRCRCGGVRPRLRRHRPIQSTPPRTHTSTSTSW